MTKKEALENILKDCDKLKSCLSEARPLPADALKKIEEALAIEYTYESNRREYAYPARNRIGGE